MEWKPSGVANLCPTCWDIVGRNEIREHEICGLMANTVYDVSLFSWVGDRLFYAISAPATPANVGSPPSTG